MIPSSPTQLTPNRRRILAKCARIAADKGDRWLLPSEIGDLDMRVIRSIKPFRALFDRERSIFPPKWALTPNGQWMAAAIAEGGAEKTE